MQYKPKSIPALHIALGGLPSKMRVEADPDIGVSATTVGELRKVTAWSENLVITTPQQRGGAKFGGGSVTSNRDSSLTTQRSIHSAIRERVVAQQELERQNFRVRGSGGDAVFRPAARWLRPPFPVTVRLTQGIMTPPPPA